MDQKGYWTWHPGDPTDPSAEAAAVERYLAHARGGAARIIAEAKDEAGRMRSAAAEQVKHLLREAKNIKAEAVLEAERTVEEGRRELGILMRRREDINAEISRVQDVLEALESFEAPPTSRNGNSGAHASKAEAPGASGPAPSRVYVPRPGGTPHETPHSVSVPPAAAAEATRPAGEPPTEDVRADHALHAYEENLRRLADSLKRLKAERGDPSMRTVEARAKQLFGGKAVLSAATQSAAFNARYVGRDKVMWLVRTLLSWDEYGEECAPPDHRSDELIAWRAQLVAISRLRPPRRRPPSETPTHDTAE
ncbi:hypothetical protein ACH4D5_37375 [Streptomyces sp. NPDC018029]|uniref:hypothetical protein n=1 Tax=Streptomyces sp. NPDC018029 TaxID=3365032 RepID=UPI003789FD28